MPSMGLCSFANEPMAKMRHGAMLRDVLMTLGCKENIDNEEKWASKLESDV
jgi:hypothetical protein